MNIIVVAHDPGGAQAVVPVARALRAQGHHVVGALEGPALQIVDVPAGDIEPDVILLGTSHDSALYQRIRAAHSNVPAVAVLDFWSNYAQRFSTPGTRDLAYVPEVVCVMDTTAKDEMLAEGFPPERVVVTGNPHYDHFADGITTQGEDTTRVLFVSQPIRADGSLPGYETPAIDEYQMLEDLIAALPATHRVSIRLHPRDELHKYDTYLSGRVSIAAESTLAEALSKSGIIVGGATPVLMQAAAAGKKVLCYEPTLVGPDPMVANRVGVTVRIASAQELKDALAGYAAGTWPFATVPMRNVWPAGAVERVVAQVLQLGATLTS